MATSGYFATQRRRMIELHLSGPHNGGYVRDLIFGLSPIESPVWSKMLEV
jgi:hypothetical protein